MDVNVELDLRGRLRPNLHNFMRCCFCQSNAKLNTVDVFHNMSQFHFTSELVALKQFQPLQHNVDYRREQCSCHEKVEQALHVCHHIQLSGEIRNQHNNICDDRRCGGDYQHFSEYP